MFSCRVLYWEPLFILLLVTGTTLQLCYLNRYHSTTFYLERQPLFHFLLVSETTLPHFTGNGNHSTYFLFVTGKTLPLLSGTGTIATQHVLRVNDTQSHYWYTYKKTRLYCVFHHEMLSYPIVYIVIFFVPIFAIRPNRILLVYNKYVLGLMKHKLQFFLSKYDIKMNEPWFGETGLNASV